MKRFKKDFFVFFLREKSDIRCRTRILFTINVNVFKELFHRTIIKSVLNIDIPDQV